jgi:hypothetical protein
MGKNILLSIPFLKIIFVEKLGRDNLKFDAKKLSKTDGVK